MDFRVSRQIIIIAIPLVIVVGLSVAIYFKTAPTPTCNDNKRNQGEEQVDCGGPCLSCAFREKKELEIYWTRVFPVRGNTYDVGVGVRNPNALLLLEDLRYEIRVYDERNVVMARRTGHTFVLPGQTAHIIETNFESSKNIVGVKFQITGEKWTFYQEQPPDVVAGERDYRIASDGSKLRSVLSATVLNRTAKDYSEVEVGAVMFDLDRNAIAVSKTTIGSLRAGEFERVTFYWPVALPDTISEMVVTPRVPPK